MLSAVAGCSGDGSPLKRGSGALFSDQNTETSAVAMAGVFDIDLDQPDEKVSDDELEDGVSKRKR